MKKLLEDLKIALNEMAQIGQAFDGNHKVQVISGDHNAHFLKDDVILLKFIRPAQCPKSIAELEPLIDYKDKSCTDRELNILIDWFSRNYVTFKGRTIEETNFERLSDEFDAQNAVIGSRAKAVYDKLNG